MIVREPASASQPVYDVIIIGGGIYGSTLLLEAARRRLKALLIERGDFGGETSYNSLRIIHGGFRYLQTLDCHRFWESVQERRWFLQTFPDLVEPLPCLMPLYNRGIRRPAVLRIALKLNDLLSSDRNRDVQRDRQLPNGKIISAAQVQQLFPLVEPENLQGGAVWYDASLPNSQRLVMAVLHWSSALGGVALNYVEAVELAKAENQVIGVLAKDVMTSQVYTYKANRVINAAGPWCRDLAAHFDRDLPCLFQPSLAWNVLFDQAAPSECAIALTPPTVKSRTYFLRPWQGRLLAGTVHSPWSAKPDILPPAPSEEQLNQFVADLNRAAPKLNLNQNQIIRIFAGQLPVMSQGSTHLSTREVILDHAQYGGPQGLYSVSGVKFTTARLVAEKTIHRVFASTELAQPSQPHPSCSVLGLKVRQGIFDYHWFPHGHDSKWLLELEHLISEEAVQHLDDLVLRRTSLGDNPHRASKVAPLICQLFNWDGDRVQAELLRLEHAISQP